MQIETAVQKRGLMTTPQGIALGILAIVAVWCLSPVTPLTMVLITVGVLLLVGLRTPIWALAALLVSQLTITSYMVNTPFGVAISLRLLLLVIIGLVVWHSAATARVELGPGAKRVLIPASIIIGVALISNVVNSGFGAAFKDFRYGIVGLLIVVLLSAVIKNLKDLKILCGVAFVGLTASAVIGVLQHYAPNGIGHHTLIPGFLAAWGTQGIRVPGLGESELELAAVLSAAVIAVLGLYLAKGVGSGVRQLTVVSIVLMAAALYFTYTRSALLAVLMGLLALALFLKTRIKGEIILVAMLILIVVVAISGIAEGRYLGGRSESGQEQSSNSRKILWQVGTAIAVANPILGIGAYRFPEVSVQYSDQVNPQLLAWEHEQYWGYSTLGSEAVHNDFLGMWVSYGTLALIAYVWLYFVVLRNLLDSYRSSKDSFIKGLSVGLAAALVAYAANSFYHNTMATFPLFWILAGFSVVIAKLALKKVEGKREWLIGDEIL